MKNSKQLLFERMGSIGGMPLNEKITKHDFLKKNNIIEDDLNYLGRGDFGEAYSTGDGRVVKTTNSKSEYEIAKEMVNKKYDGFTSIYDVNELDKFGYIILMEELDIDSDIEDLYYELSSLLESQSLPIQYIHYFDEDEYNGEISDELRDFMNGIEEINSSYRMIGIEASDVRPENLGYDREGNLKAFDIDDKSK